MGSPATKSGIVGLGIALPHSGQRKFLSRYLSQNSPPITPTQNRITHTQNTKSVFDIRCQTTANRITKGTKRNRFWSMYLLPNLVYFLTCLMVSFTWEIDKDYLPIILPHQIILSQKMSIVGIITYHTPLCLISNIACPYYKSNPEYIFLGRYQEPLGAMPSSDT